MTAAFDLFGKPNIIIETCCNCQVIFGMHAPTYDLRRNDKKSFYCPNGHAQHYTGESEIQKLEKQLANERQYHQWTKTNLDEARRERDTAKKSAYSFKGKLNSVKRRVANGVCPCCNRTFQNLHNHMKKQHPHFKKDE